MLFSNVGFRLMPGRRVALVGGNGVGKTTCSRSSSERPTPARCLTKDCQIGCPTESWSESIFKEVMAGAGEVLELEERLR
ncbi:MAG: hypothetical protein R2710_24630 [Acidimicrobiales bacterium]